MTVTDYINLTRVRRSLKLLSGSSLSMPEIAERCGFSDANYYTRTFRKIHGSTPTEYRKSLQTPAKSSRTREANSPAEPGRNDGLPV